MKMFKDGYPAFKNLKGQSTIEFTFSMVVTVLLILGLIRVFQWTGNDLAERRVAHETALLDGSCGDGPTCPLEQIRPTFFYSAELRAAVNSNIFGN